MLTVYIFCAIIGGGLILLSAFSGGDHEHSGDTDFSGDHDISHDADTSAGGHEHTMGHDGPWIPFFSLRFWTYLVGIFGITGLLLTLLTDSAEPATGLLSLGTGFVTGMIAASLVQWLRTHESDSTARDEDLLGLRAMVTVPIREQQVGRIRATVKGELLDILASAEQPLALPEGSEVVIVGMDNGRATVLPLNELLEERK